MVAIDREAERAVRAMSSRVPVVIRSQACGDNNNKCSDVDLAVFLKGPSYIVIQS